MPPVTPMVTFQRRVTLIKSRLTKLQAEVTAISEKALPLSSVDVRLLTIAATDLETRVSEFDRRLDKVISSTSDEDIDMDNLAQEQDEVSNLVTAIRSLLTTLLPDPTEARTPTGDGARPIPQTSLNVRLPALELKHFSGDPLTWVTFINLFETSVHKNTSLDLVSKFQYLLSVVSGEPLNLIKSLPITAANYMIALDLIKARYHSVRRLSILHLNALLDLPSVTSTHYKGLRTFVDAFNEHSQALHGLNCDVVSNNVVLSAVLLRKLDATLRKRLEEYRVANPVVNDDRDSLPPVNAIIQFLNVECQHIEESSIGFSTPSGSKPLSVSKPQVKASTSRHPQASSSHVSFTSVLDGNTPARTSQKTYPCFVCDKLNHKVYQCPVFSKQKPKERLSTVRQHKRCTSCLGNHQSRDCKSTSSCSVCRKRHHTMLHLSNDSPPLSKEAAKDSAPISDKKSTHEDASVSLSLQADSSDDVTCTTVLLGTALVKLTASSGRTHVFRALLDSGSSTDIISERAAQLLEAPRTHTTHTFVGLAQVPTRSKGMVNLDVAALSGRQISRKNTFFILDRITVNLPRTSLSPEVIQRVKPFVLADPTFHLPSGIDILLGAALYPHLLTHESHSLGPNMPVAVGTHLGFVIMGKAPCPTCSSSEHVCKTQPSLTLLSTTESDLHDALQRFWQQEEPPSRSTQSDEEKLCDQFFSDTHSRQADGRYIVRLPFRPNHPPLGTSLVMAEKRLYALESKFRSRPDFQDLYVEFMNDYSSSGHMSLVESPSTQQEHFYLPHHGVLKHSSTPPKLRTVFDASAKSSSLVSLNDTLLTGRKLQADVVDLLLHFREHNVVFTCDIRQMYRQILLHPDDRRYQRILWRTSSSLPISTYELNTVTYGLNSSPYLAIRTLSQLADDEGHAFPAAATILRSHTYVDDVIAGAADEEQAMDLQRQLISLLRCGGFELRKWSSNTPSLLNSLPQAHLESPVFLEESSNPQLSILGLKWSPLNDCFTYTLTLKQDGHTKREILSLIAKIYDPCGFLAPVTMWAKCFMQLLWSRGLSWDEPLPHDLLTSWQTFVSSARAINNIEISRPLHLSESSSTQLHGFADASESGYAAVVYIRCQIPDRPTIVRQILAKTRVAPLKRVTLPRLELCAAHLLAQLAQHCLAVFAPKIGLDNTFLWSDSTVTLTWIQTPSYRLKTYVANRVALIQELTPPHCWRHIISAHNPADCASRGTLPADLPNHSLWWSGPPWLHQPQSAWPISHAKVVDLSTTGEAKENPLCVMVTTPPVEWDLLSKFSSFTKLQYVMAYILRFINNCRHVNKKLGIMTSQELENSSTQIFRLVQASHFSEDLTKVKDGLPPSTRLRRLSPFIDSKGLLRVGGRLKASPLPYTSRHTVILPKKHHVVELLIDMYHTRHLHAGPQLTQSLLARHVWILSARSIIRSRIFKCVTCFRLKPRNKPPLMGDLPASRVTPARPFSSTGIDYCGPIMVTAQTIRAAKVLKVYLCVFICMVTKAVHIEVVTDLTTDAFIAALTRFVSRRGLCSDIYSDCGTNFVGANKQLHKLVSSALYTGSSQDQITHFTAPRHINFHFNSPSAPHQGGLWEAAVKSAKHHLRRVIGDNTISYQELVTLTTQVEAMLNSRPLTPLSHDPNDLEPLTPGHFLIGGPLASVPEPDVAQTPSNRLKHWHLVQALHQRLWKRWSLDYLHTLQQRTKWDQPSRNLRIGDMVLVHQPTPPLTWPLARVVAVSPGADGTVRVVQLQTPHGLLTRPAVKVFPLPGQL